jgi:hypothetical protein
VIGGAALLISHYDERAAQERAYESQHLNSVVLARKPDRDYSQKDIDNPDRYGPSWLTFFRWPTGTTTLAIILTLIAIAEQTSETKRATDSQRAKDRARLFVEISDAPTRSNFNRILQSTELREFYWSLGIRLTQHGSTKAFDAIGCANIVVAPSQNKLPRASHKKMLKMEGIPKIIPGDPPPLYIPPVEGFIEFRPIGEATLTRIAAEEECAHFFGWVQYEDVFGASHKTTFHYIWHPEIREPVPQEDG